jgi:hypothetical protein
MLKYNYCFIYKSKTYIKYIKFAIRILMFILICKIYTISWQCKYHACEELALRYYIIRHMIL